MREQPRRRRVGSGDPDLGLNYAAVGATATADVLVVPPDGFRPVEVQRRIGSGARRFELAARSLMTWGVQRGAGMLVEDVRTEGTARPTSAGSDRVAGEDDLPWITPGTTARLVLPGRTRTFHAPVKVVLVVEEAGRVGFAYGSRPGHPAQTEQLLLLEHDADDAVRFTLRSISRPSGRRWSPPSAHFHLRQRRYHRRFPTALHPARTA